MRRILLFTLDILRSINPQNIEKSEIVPGSLHEIQISYSPKIRFEQRSLISCSSDAAEVLRNFYDEQQMEYCESIWVAYLTMSNRVLGVLNHSSGGLSKCVVDIKQVIGVACKSNAAGLILSHNHPSGALRASNADKHLTDKLKAACEIMELNFLDHLILTREGYYSFADEGRL